MALDEESLLILEELSASLGVSKAEVIRRSLREAKDLQKKAEKKMTPLEATESLMKNPPLTEAQAEAWKKEIREEREAWRSPWDEYLEKSNS